MPTMKVRWTTSCGVAATGKRVTRCGSTGAGTTAVVVAMMEVVQRWVVVAVLLRARAADPVVIEALEVLEAARAGRPADRRLLYALATISRDAGHTEAALGYAHALRELRPGDSGTAALIRELEADRE